ncbi:MAG: zinc D-Ala-D-Ala carboxypeptidase [Patescibacteria group bacterium]|nr:zinc D-Ala-D-Ala carboxypeptidase [Patescibacteria group bacterium]
MREHIRKLLANDFVVLVLIALAFWGFFKYFNIRIEKAVEKTTSEFTLGQEVLNNKVTELEKAVVDTLAALAEEQENNSALRQRFYDIRDTVGELEKLSTTDKELLMKYSKVYFLNEHYVPLKISEIGEDYRTSKSTNYQIHSEVLPNLENLIEEGREDGVNILVQSAYRSFSTQSQLKSAYTVTYGTTTANRFSADQGYSEHQLGTTVDFTSGTTGTLEGFDKTPEYAWLLENAHRYGFILSYPAGNAYYKFEPWHWRFVGIDLARDLKREEMNFYDMDQRVIDTYLTKIFD